MRRYDADPYPLVAQYGVCCKCGVPMKGRHGYFWPAMPRGKKLYCEHCGEDDYRRFLLTAVAEEHYYPNY